MDEQTTNNDVIKDAQQMLHRLSRAIDSIGPVPVNGVYGEQTQKAVAEFQNYMGITVTGILNRETYELLVEASKALSIVTSESNPIYPFERRLAAKSVCSGDCFDLVTIIQIMLHTISIIDPVCSKVKVTGTFDTDTEDAVKSFQKANQLPCTGSVDLLTWNRLARLYNKYVDSEGE